MPPLIAGAIVFWTAAGVLVLEILAGRLLAPYVGVTLETWTGIIGTVLAGISIGTWLGGWLADRVDPRQLLGPLLILGGVLALLVVPLVGYASGLRLRADAAGIVIYTAIGFFLPAAVLSAVGPTVVKLQLHDLDRTGSVVGRLSAIGTAGAIAGTFGTGFVLISAVPSRPIVIGLGVLLVLAGAAVCLTVGRVRGIALPVLAGVAVVTGGGWALGAPDPCERESAYFCVRVVPDPGVETGRTLYLDTLRHAYIDLADPTHLEFSYTQLIGDVIDAMAPPREPLQALHVGGGGFTMPRYLAATRPGSVSRVLELDPVVLATAREELGLVTGPELSVRLGDARLGIAEEPDASYDLVIGDAFGGLAVPWHLTTRELIGQIQRLLRPGGLYVINVIDYPPLAFARAEMATLRAVFARVAVLGPQSRVEIRDGGNVILVASDAEIPVEAILKANGARGANDALVGDAEEIAAFIGESPILRDDYAPVDQLLTLR